MARRAWHRTPWINCNRYVRPGKCLRCAWREITGKRRRAMEKHLAWVRDLREHMEPVKYRKDESGRWRRA